MNAALEVAERICKEIAGSTVAALKSSISYTVSIGIAEGKPGVNARATLEFALHLADEALYLAKRSGKNQTVISPPDTQSLHGEAAFEQN